jgi:hypothetical protein
VFFLLTTVPGLVEHLGDCINSGEPLILNLMNCPEFINVGGNSFRLLKTNVPSG